MSLHLLHRSTSRRNKIWVCESRSVRWKWAGEPWRSRLLIEVDRDSGKYLMAQSYEEDVKPTLKWAKDT